MENKLQELTNKLYEEGLSKGRSDAEKMIAEAEAKAAKIVADAEEKARGIDAAAKRAAEELHKNTLTEISLAGKQAVAALKEQIGTMIVTRSVSNSVGKVTVDPAFIKDMLLAVAANWNGADSEKVTLSALLPAEWETRFGKEFETTTHSLLKEGIEVGYSAKVKSGFKVGEKDGGYYIGFSDDDFNALLGEYLKEKVSKILYSNDSHV